MKTHTFVNSLAIAGFNVVLVFIAFACFFFPRFMFLGGLVFLLILLIAVSVEKSRCTTRFFGPCWSPAYSVL
jgi:hypothetical protein